MYTSVLVIPLCVELYEDNVFAFNPHRSCCDSCYVSGQKAQYPSVILLPQLRRAKSHSIVLFTFLIGFVLLVGCLRSRGVLVGSIS